MASCFVCRWLTPVVVGLLLFLAWVPVAGAFHTDFSYEIYEFTLEGNLPGSFIDSFDDNSTLDPWFAAMGTVREQGGSLFLESPGTHDDAFNTLFPGVMLDRSDVTSWPALFVADGYGDFLATSVWAANPLPVNGSESMYLLTGDGLGGLKGFGLFFTDFGPSVASAFGIEPGLKIGQAEFDAVEATHEILRYDAQYYSVDPTEPMSALFLRIDFDDATNLMTTSFKFNADDPYQAPFLSIEFNPGPGTSFNLYGDPMSYVPEPSTALLLATGLAGLAAARRRRSLH
jgi:hypothetical protein